MPRLASIGTSIAVDTRENTTDTPKCSATGRQIFPASIIQRRPSHRIGGVKAAQMYMADIYAMKSLRQGIDWLRESRAMKSWLM
jgi:hypothetical protein